MIYTVDQNGRKEFKWLLEALLNCAEDELKGRLSEHPPVISLVGGGGKTTCVMAMASECFQKGLKAVVATTTHMQMPYDQFLLDAEDMDAFYRKMNTEGQVWLGRRLDPALQFPDMVKYKSRSLAIEFVRKVCSEGGYPVLIEADGAKCLPCKTPGENEPVIPDETTIVVNVYGMDALGKRFGETVFRPESACEITGKSLNDPVEEEDIIKLANHPNGGRKRVSERMDYQVVLNKADTAAQAEEALRMAQLLIESGISRVHVTSGLRELIE